MLMMENKNCQQGQVVLQEQQQQSQGPAAAVSWERFLHIRSIKVLLVENDDCTRHIVTALLRNCNFEVIEAANGVQAWRILEDLNNHVDLVLTEVVTPCVSGIGLLSKIMSHKTRKTVPVIMMSSHDSMGLVFKCLSKGAVDFLVKPIRKNELKNLWQHVWRRCHSSSGSGSVSGTQTQKSVSNVIKKSCNNSGSNSGKDNGSTGLKNCDGSDDGSGKQSSWTKKPVEFDSSEAASPLDQVAEGPDSTCAQVIRPNTGTSGNKRGHLTTEREGHEEELTGDKDLRKSGNLESLAKKPIDDPVKLIGIKHKTLLEAPSNSSSRRMAKGQANTSGEFQSNMHEAVNVESSHPQITGSEFEAPRELTNKLEIKNEALDDSTEPAIEPSLKRLRSLKDKGKSIENNLTVLRHSELSAFSRYNTSSKALRTPNGVTGSSYVIDNCSEVKKKPVCDVQLHSHENHVYQNSKAGSNNNIDKGSTTNKFPVNPLFFASESTTAINGLHPSSAFELLKNDQQNTLQHATPLKPMPSSVLSPTGGLSQDLQIQHPQQHHYHQHHFHYFESQEELPNHDTLSLKKVIWTIGESDMDLGGRSGSGEANGSGYEKRIDQNKLARRLAALSKFRQKRKERCYKKKVRYQNRKRLAEQRPRIRGQFVRLSDHETSNSAADD